MKDGTRKRGLGRVFAYGLLGVVGVVVCLYLLRHPILRGVGALVTHTDRIEESDVIVVLTGGEDTRPFYAAELYAQGVADRILIAAEEMTPTARLGLMPAGTDVSVEVLRQEGVPNSAIQVISGTAPVTSTRDEALVIATYAAEHGIREITVVTSTFHTARARYTLNKAFGDADVTVRMAAASAWNYDETRWWESEAGISAYGMELLKWVHTLGVLN